MCGENEIATDTACCNGLKCCEMPLCTDDTDCNCKTECDGVIEREDVDGSCCDNLKRCKSCADTLQCTSHNGTCQASCGENEIATDTACCNGLQCCEMPLCTSDTDCSCKTECDGVIEGVERAGSCCDNLKCCKPCTGVCGGNFTGLIGSFSSTNYPCNYSINQDCFYSISVSDGDKIKLTFTTFFLEALDHDYVDVYDGESVNDPLLLHQTGGPHDGITAQSTLNKMLVRFKSDFADVWPGFKANYEATI
ncbi:keratin-associated protein 5-5-like [Mytilus trossulus]|uniref:keratin-associated protein 5-5-like n=1 Tax=Mytilus trossulus TaxID=6551 RepID=UPI0030071F8A